MRGKIADEIRAAARDGLPPGAGIFVEGGHLERVDLVANEARDHRSLAPGRTAQTIIAAPDKVSGPLWHDGEHSYHGRNDKVPAAIAKKLKTSLLLVAPESLNLVVASESKYGGGEERKVRADFHLNGVHYNFVVTDPVTEAKYLGEKDGVYPIKGARLCVSLAEVINGNAIKLVAAVITPDRAG